MPPFFIITPLFSLGILIGFLKIFSYEILFLLLIILLICSIKSHKYKIILLTCFFFCGIIRASLSALKPISLKKGKITFTAYVYKLTQKFTVLKIVDSEKIKILNSKFIYCKLNRIKLKKYSFIRGSGIIKKLNNKTKLTKIKILKSNFFIRVSNFLRERIVTSSKILPSNVRAFVIAICLGHKNAFTKPEYQKFLNFGLLHIIAVSGLHIFLLSTLLSSIILSIKLFKNKIGFGLLLAVPWTYILVAGVRASLIRALAMYNLLLLAKYLKKLPDKLNILFVTIFIMLCIDPKLVFASDFYLTCSATASILLFFNKIKKFGGLFRYPPLALTTSALLFVIPTQILLFSSITPMSIITNTIYLPLLSIIATLSISFGISAIIFQPATYLLKPVLTLMYYLFKVTTTPLYNSGAILNIPLSFWFKFILFLTVAEILVLLQNRRFLLRKIVFILGTFSLLFFILSPFDSQNFLKINFINTGIADSCIITSSHISFLIDAGTDKKYIPFSFIKFYLNQLPDKIDIVLISHFHSDHYNLLPFILKYKKVKCVILPSFNKNNLITQKLLNLIRKFEAKPIFMKKYKKIKSGNLKLDIYNPCFFTKKTLKENNRSLIVQLNFKNFSAYFTGDIEKRAESIMLNKKIFQKSTLLKAPHHGSITSSSNKFLAYIEPVITVITSTIKNKFNFPSKTVLKRLYALQSFPLLHGFKLLTDGKKLLIIYNKSLFIKNKLGIN